MRGEEEWSRKSLISRGELPPHARRRGLDYGGIGDGPGITSACAEKRRDTQNLRGFLWNYLRMRGEEAAEVFQPSVCEELPPHARRRAKIHRTVRYGHGITSACAEKSPRDMTG